MNTAHKARTGTGILCLTRSGFRVAAQVAQYLPEAVVYLPARLQPQVEGSLRHHVFQWFEDAFRSAFHSHQALICIMAAGIVVRSLAALMESKYVDPAVVVVDEKGQYAISLISGHLGGANRLARTLAGWLGAQAVITTATDVENRPAVDVMAGQLGARMEPRENIKLINRCLAEDEAVYLYSPWPLQDELIHGFIPLRWPVGGDRASHVWPGSLIQRPAVVISHHSPADEAYKELIHLRPGNLAMGIGCRKNITYQQLETAVRQVLQANEIDPRCIQTLATITCKAEEAAIQQLSREWDLPVAAFSPEAINALEGSFEASEWVKQSIGVGGVCEPAARLAVNQGITIITKQKVGPVAISLAMERSWWWDWGPAASST